MKGTGPDLRDGEKLNMRELPPGVEAYRQPSGEIALWDGQRHVVISADGKQMEVALQQLAAARAWNGGRA